MRIVRQFLPMALAITLLGGCASNPTPKTAQISPKDIVWRDASPEQSVVYLLRTPHDHSQVIASIDGMNVATLAVSTYTAVFLPPGKHRLVATEAGAGDGVSPMLELDLKPGERRFFYLSGLLATQSQASRIAGALAGPIVSTALYLNATGNRTAEKGSHSWTECSELDARGLASIASFVASVQGTP